MRQALLFESRVERAFADWLETEDGRVVVAEVVFRARRLKAAGYTRWGIAALFEAIRYDRAVTLNGDAFARLNNTLRAPLARHVMAKHSDLQGFFETRQLRGAA